MKMMMEVLDKDFDSSNCFVTPYVTEEWKQFLDEELTVVEAFRTSRKRLTEMLAESRALRKRVALHFGSMDSNNNDREECKEEQENQ